MDGKQSQGARRARKRGAGKRGKTEARAGISAARRRRRQDVDQRRQQSVRGPDERRQSDSGFRHRLNTAPAGHRRIAVAVTAAFHARHARHLHTWHLHPGQTHFRAHRAAQSRLHGMDRSGSRRRQKVDALGGAQNGQQGPQQRQQARQKPKPRCCAERHVTEIMPYFPGKITYASGSSRSDCRRSASSGG